MTVPVVAALFDIFGSMIVNITDKKGGFGGPWPYYSLSCVLNTEVMRSIVTKPRKWTFEKCSLAYNVVLPTEKMQLRCAEKWATYCVSETGSAAAVNSILLTVRPHL